VIRIFPL